MIQSKLLWQELQCNCWFGMHFAMKVTTLLLQYSSGSVTYFAFPSIGKSWLLSAPSILLLYCLTFFFYFMYLFYTQQFSYMPVVLPIVPKFFFHPLI